MNLLFQYNKLLANIAKYPVVGKFGDGDAWLT